MFGLDISDASIEILEIKRSFGRTGLVGYGRAELPDGIVRDGAVLKKKELGEAIKKLLKEAKPRAIKGKGVILSLPESKVFTHVFKFPANLSVKQLARVLRFEVPNVLPVSLEEVYSDFLVLGKNGNDQEVFFVAVPKKIVDDLREVIKNIGLIPRVFDMESLSFARALGKTVEDGSLLVDIGARTTIISIFDKKGIRFTVNLPVAGNLFTETVAKKLKVKKEEAENLKKTCGLIPKGGPCRGGQIFLVVQSTLQPILREAQDAIKFYEESKGGKIKKVILCGGSSMMPNIANYFQENLGLKALVGKPEAAGKLSISKAAVSPLLLNVFGLALRGAKKNPESAGINLMFDLEKLAHKKRQGKRKAVRYLIIGAFALALFGFGVFGFYKFAPEFISKFSAPKTVPISFEETLSLSSESEQTTARILEINKDSSKTFSAMGKRIIEGRAEGKVKIINNSSGAQTLVATTRLLRDDTLFRLKDRVTAPAGETAEVAVYADQIGAASDLGPGKFTIPGLSPSLQKLIYAESEAPMTGGATETKVVGAADILEAQKKLIEEISVLAQSEVESALKNIETLLPAPLEVEILQMIAEPGQDEVANEFKLQITAKVKFLAINAEFLNKLMENELAKTGIRRPSVYEFQNLELVLAGYDKASGEAAVKISAEAVKM